MITIKRDKCGRFIEGVPFHTKETKRKISQSHIGIGRGIPLSEKQKKAISEGMKRATIHMKDKKNCGVTLYQSSHLWIKKNYGQPQKCDFCKREKPPKGKGVRDYFSWANKDGKYEKNIKNWFRLCQICHRNYDFKRTR
jgi:hypothetical protein